MTMQWKSSRRRLAALIGAAWLLSGCPAKKGKPEPKRQQVAAVDAGAPTLPPAPPLPIVPPGLPERPESKEAPLTPELVALGQALFFDVRMSGTRKMSCASCHDPDHGWADGRPRADTAGRKPNLRRTQTLIGAAWTQAYGWDGRFASLEELLPAHWKGQLSGQPDAVVAELAGIPFYALHFQRALGGAPSEAGVLRALAAFVRTVTDGHGARPGDGGAAAVAPWDRYERGDQAAVGPDAVAGYALFSGRAQCASCHPPPLYTDQAYHRLGLVRSTDEGRGRVDPAPDQAGAFRTPTLRGAAHRGPYFHDGSAFSLEEAIEAHLAGARGKEAVDPALRPVTLTDAEIGQLVAFLRALTAPSERYLRPSLPALGAPAADLPRWAQPPAGQPAGTP
jgi:cytochrome c peroxidase